MSELVVSDLGCVLVCLREYMSSCWCGSAHVNVCGGCECALCVYVGCVCECALCECVV